MVQGVRVFGRGRDFFLLFLNLQLRGYWSRRFGFVYIVKEVFIVLYVGFCLDYFVCVFEKYFSGVGEGEGVGVMRVFCFLQEVIGNFLLIQVGCIWNIG